MNDLPEESHARDGWLMLLAIAILAVCCILASRAWVIQEDEVLILVKGLHSPQAVIDAFLSGVGQHVHPPLSDLVLAAWLHLTHAANDLLRLPNIAFYLIGIWWCAKLATRLAVDARAGMAVIIFAILWPYGHQEEWMFGWYSFAFMLVAGTLLAYHRHRERPTIGRLTVLILASVALVWTNYFGWAILGLVGLDWLIRLVRSTPVDKLHPGHLASWVVVTLAGFAPLIPALIAAFDSRVVGDQRSIVSRLAYGVWNLYLSIGGESVAPWVIPAIAVGVIGAVVAFATAWWCGGNDVRKLLLGYLAALFALAIIGQSGAKRILFLTPLLLIGLGVAVRIASGSARHLIITGLAAVAAVGWIGVAAPREFATLRLLDPWPEAATAAATWLDDGGSVVGFHPTLFYYLTLIEGDGVHYDPAVRRKMTRAITVYSDPDAISVPDGRVLVVESSGFIDRQRALGVVADRLRIRCNEDWSRGYLPDPNADLRNKHGAEATHQKYEIALTAFTCPALPDSAGG